MPSCGLKQIDNAVTADIASSMAALNQRLKDNNIFFVAQRKNASNQLVVFYSLKVVTGQIALVELTFSQGAVSVGAVVKSENAAFSSVSTPRMLLLAHQQFLLMTSDLPPFLLLCCLALRWLPSASQAWSQSQHPLQRLRRQSCLLVVSTCCSKTRARSLLAACLGCGWLVSSAVHQ